MFESLDDAGVRTAGTTYLMYRGRHEHRVSQDTALTRIAGASLFRRPILGPKELFYADVYASRKTPCKSQLGMPGIRDQHSGCVGAYLVEHDLFDFLLLSLPDNDTHSHKYGPDAQVTSIHAADREIERVMHAGGGPERVPRRARGDRRRRPLARARRGRTSTCSARCRTSTSPARAARRPTRARSRSARRSAARWSTSCSRRAASELLPRLLETLLDDRGRRPRHAHARTRVGVITSERGTLRVRARRGGRATRAAGAGSCAASLDVLDARIEDGVLRQRQLPRRAGARLGGARAARRRATCSSPRRPATSSSTGAAARTSAAARTARCTAATRSARS